MDQTETVGGRTYYNSLYYHGVDEKRHGSVAQGQGRSLFAGDAAG
jgi:hypothetical protein